MSGGGVARLPGVEAERRQARVRTRAAERLAAPPPTTATSYSFMPEAFTCGSAVTTVGADSGNDGFTGGHDGSSEAAVTGPVGAAETTAIAVALDRVGPRLRRGRSSGGSR